MIPGFAVVCAPWTLQEGPRSATASSSANLFMTTSCAPLVGHVARFWSLNWPTSSAGSLILAGLANGFFIFSSFLSLSPPRPPSPPLVQVFQQRACPAGLQDGLYHLKCSWLWLVVVCWMNVTVVVFSFFFSQRQNTKWSNLLWASTSAIQHPPFWVLKMLDSKISITTDRIWDWFILIVTYHMPFTVKVHGTTTQSNVLTLKISEKHTYVQMNCIQGKNVVLWRERAPLLLLKRKGR